ncbi:MAG: SDR family NAD(P)-dependent oxidoreductase [Desulfatiglandaceae bacterium]
MALDYELRGKTGIVTGAASGIGKAAALLMAHMGARLCLVDRDEKRLHEAISEIGIGGDAESLICDVAEASQVNRMVADAMRSLESLDFLVNSAGILRRTAFPEIDPAEWDLMMGVNLRGAFLCCRAAVPHMLKCGRGVIVNVASLAGRSCSILGGAHYTTAKHGLVGLSRHLARELGPRGIRVNAFCPGATLTPMTLETTTESERKRVAGSVPLGRWGLPEEQARVIAFLVSDAAVFITGACIDSNGGSLMV